MQGFNKIILDNPSIARLVFRQNLGRIASENGLKWHCVGFLPILTKLISGSQRNVGDYRRFLRNCKYHQIFLGKILPRLIAHFDYSKLLQSCRYFTPSVLFPA